MEKYLSPSGPVMTNGGDNHISELAPQKVADGILFSFKHEGGLPVTGKERLSILFPAEIILPDLTLRIGNYGNT